MVLADGSQVRANATENSDLFWAIRGGGGNFGVVTAFTFRLHPVEHRGGRPDLLVAGASRPQVLRAYREFIPAAPRELNGFFAFLTVPPVPPFPEELHGRKVCGDRVVLQRQRRGGRGGDGADARGGQRRCCTAPARCRSRRCRARSTRSTRRATSGTGGPTSCASCPTRRSPQHVKWGNKMPSGQSTMHLYPIDGAVHDVADTDTPFSYRDVPWAEVIVGVDPDPANARGDHSTGRSTTGRRPTRTRPAAPTSTS